MQFEEPDANRKGLVAVLYNIGLGAKSGLLSDVSWKLPKVNEGLPVRVAAVHICYDKADWKPIDSILKLAFNTFAKVRIRTYYGESSSCLIV